MSNQAPEWYEMKQSPIDAAHTIQFPQILAVPTNNGDHSYHPPFGGSVANPHVKKGGTNSIRI
ncbi:uncharacterized protein FOMMEDRAFT_159717 [Fomitiporia mediterranea MF3/22]|uniref:uncharacterized protein n=1 Tax=Fomitiporia mediterranea (strain MF3/22) TaxID=694068 RepID=UPI00044082FB|nr:uncharacterized protein FOMMEDRAFT_159717 [Fomitiporia mediterranea MF3/22]EJD00105.1 hypothetical protein FOMMEDRAFT_159717 [Fomitiporia mediterranea MF3/22]